LNPRPTRASIGAYYPPNYFEGRDNEQSHRRYEAEFRYLPRASGRLLDIGTASGDFIRLASQRGFEAFGIEPSEHAASVARVVRARFPGGAPFTRDSFDIITA